jgi:hypothetical protein
MEDILKRRGRAGKIIQTVVLVFIVVGSPFLIVWAKAVMDDTINVLILAAAVIGVDMAAVVEIVHIWKGDRDE